jgi:uncharacterized SAM-binding protein YcdF (DUF218 family)
VIRLLRRAAIVFAALGFVYLVVTFFQVWTASRADHATEADAIVVLGAAQYNGRPSPVLQARLDHAIDLYEAGVAPVIWVTGGRIPGDSFSEASASDLYLQQRGIPKDVIELENQGTSSWESLAATARFLRAEGTTEVVLVSSPYHALRTEEIADEVGLVGHASPAGGGATLARLGRETLAVAVGRVIGHRRLVDLDDRVSR